MNITVVTPYDSSNYGAFLQAYCLQQYLVSAGHSVTHIPTRPADYVEALYFHRMPVTKKEKLIPGVYRRHTAYGKKKYELFSRAQKAFHVTEDLSDTELIVLGSDEIWNVKNPVFAASVFWGKINIPTISYAASVGDADEETFRSFPDQIEQLRRLKCALVRDENTRRFVEAHSGLKPEIVCDPTILWPVDRYGEECEDPYVRKHNCLLVYSYGLSKKEIREIRSYAKKKHLKTVSCCFPNRWCDHQVECGPLAFSSLIRQCREYYTSTFHGTIFGLLNHAKFVCSTEHPKTLHLLQQFGLEDRLLRKENFSADALADIFSRRIAYKKVDRIVLQMREQSGQKLEEAIRLAVRTGQDDKPDEKAAENSAGIIPGKTDDITGGKAGEALVAKVAETPDSGAGDKFDPMICFPNECTGCFACRQACHQDAVRIVTDAQGRKLPLIDEDKCIRCGACKAVCPGRNKSSLHEIRACYAARGRNEEEIRDSSSGGMAALLSQSMVREGGVVCGAVVRDRRVIHVCASTLEETAAFKGSKYVQSDISESYEEIRGMLKDGRRVLFIGTPCQVDAMNRFFGRNTGFYTADIICHGVPPMEYLTKHLADITGGHSFDGFRFRGSTDDFTLKVFDGSEILYAKHETEDPYFHAFLTSMTYRENCYNCKYTCSRRAGDLTLGDFWGLDHSTLKNTYEGNISVVLVNTEKGQELFEMIRPLLVCEERETAEAVAGNPQLRRPSMKHKDRTAFISAYMKSGDFRTAVAATGLEQEMKRLQFGRTGKGKVYVRIKKMWQKLV